MDSTNNIPAAMWEICRRLGFSPIPYEWDSTHTDPAGIDEFMALYMEYRESPNTWFRDLLGHLILDTVDTAADRGVADVQFLAKVREVLKSVVDEQQKNIRDQLDYWASENDVKAQLLCPVFRGLLRLG